MATDEERRELRMAGGFQTSLEERTFTLRELLAYSLIVGMDADSDVARQVIEDWGRENDADLDEQLTWTEWGERQDAMVALGATFLEAKARHDD